MRSGTSAGTGRPLRQAIVAAPQNAAHACGRDSRPETQEPGKSADILAVDGNPLQDIRALARPQFVMNGGVVIRP